MRLGRRPTGGGKDKRRWLITSDGEGRLGVLARSFRDAEVRNIKSFVNDRERVCWTREALRVIR